MSDTEANEAATEAEEDTTPLTDTEGTGDQLLLTSPVWREPQDLHETETPARGGAAGTSQPPPITRTY